jgi:hypothetical protein
VPDQSASTEGCEHSPGAFHDQIVQLIPWAAKYDSRGEVTDTEQSVEPNSVETTGTDAVRNPNAPSQSATVLCHCV